MMARYRIRYFSRNGVGAWALTRVTNLDPCRLLDAQLWARANCRGGERFEVSR